MVLVAAKNAGKWVYRDRLLAHPLLQAGCEVVFDDRTSRDLPGEAERISVLLSASGPSYLASYAEGRTGNVWSGAELRFYGVAGRRGRIRNR